MLLPHLRIMVSSGLKIVNTLCLISEHLQDTLLTKLLGLFIEVNKSQFFQRVEILILDCNSLSLQHFEKFEVNPTPESIYMEEEC